MVLSNGLRRVAATGPLLSRIVAAMVGGYALAALASIAATALPTAKTEGVFIGMLLSFWVYTGAVIWVFAVRSATRAWVGLLIAAVPLLACAAAAGLFAAKGAA